MTPHSSAEFTCPSEARLKRSCHNIYLYLSICLLALVAVFSNLRASSNRSTKRQLTTTGKKRQVSLTCTMVLSHIKSGDQCHSCTAK